MVDPHTGRWYTVGDSGASFEDIPKGAIVFNHLQTEELLKNGYVSGRGASLVSGTAMVSGGIKVSSAKASAVSKLSSKTSPKTSTNKTKKTSSKKKKSTSKTKKKGKTALEKFNEWAQQLFDWIEVKLDRLSRKTERYQQKAERAIDRGNYSTAKKDYQIAMDSTSSQIKVEKSAQTKYQKQASSVISKAISKGLISKKDADKIKKQVADGSIKISSYNEKMQAAIKQYQTYYEKSLDCVDSIENLIDTYIELAEAMANVPIEKLQEKLETIGEIQEVLEAKYDTVSNATDRNSIIADQNKQAKSEKDAYNTAYNETQAYLEQTWKSSGVKSALKTSANSSKKMGEKLSLAGIKVGTKEYEAVVKYNAALEVQKNAYYDAEKANYEYTKTIQNNAKLILENIVGDFEETLGVIDANISKLDAELDYRAATGQSQISEGQKNVYRNSIAENERALQTMIGELSALQTSLGQNRSNMSQDDTVEVEIKIIGLEEEILRTKTAIADLQTELDNININIIARDIKQLASETERLQDAISLKEAKGIIATEWDYSALIRNSQSYVEQLKRQNAELETQSAKYEYGSEKYDELLSQIEENEDAIRDAAIAQVEWNNAIAELPLTKLERALELVEAISDYNESLNNLKEAEGGELATSDYEQLIWNNSDKLSSLVQERSLALANYQKALADSEGVYGGKTADEWKAQYNNFGTEINNVKIAMEELKDSMREDVEFRAFNKAFQKTEMLRTRLEIVSALIDEDDYYDSNGKLTNQGYLAIATANKKAETYKRDINAAYAEINKIKSMRGRDGYSDAEYIKDLQSAEEELLSAIQSESDARKEIEDVVKRATEVELKAINKLISAYSEVVDAQKEIYDYQKSIKGQSKEVAGYQKQLMAYQGDDSEENKARLQQLRVSYEDAKDGLEEIEYDFYVSQQKKMLDSLSEEYQEALENATDQIVKSVVDTTDSIRGGFNSLEAELDRLFGTIGDTYSAYSNSANSLISSMTGEINGGFSGMSNLCENIVSTLNSDGTLDRTIKVGSSRFASDAERCARGGGTHKMSDIGRANITTIDGLNINLPNVTNYEEFKHAMQHDKEFEKMVQAMTTDKLTGGSKLRKYYC